MHGGGGGGATWLGTWLGVARAYPRRVAPRRLCAALCVASMALGVSPRTLVAVGASSSPVRPPGLEFKCTRCMARTY